MQGSSGEKTERERRAGSTQRCAKMFSRFSDNGKEREEVLSAANPMLRDNWAEEVCVPHVTRMVRGEKNSYKVEPGVRRTGTPRQERGFTPKHSVDEVGLYTEAEENDVDHLQGLAGYTDQVTKKVTQAVCQADNKCALKLVPGAPAYNLADL